MNLELQLIPNTPTDYSAIFISPEQFSNDVQFLQTVYPNNVPDKEQLESILEHCQKNNLKVSYTFSKGKEAVSFSAHIGEEFFSNGMFLDITNKTLKKSI